MNEATAISPPVSRLERIVEDERFRRTILLLIVINAVLLGFETSRTLSPGTMDSIMLANKANAP